jgi:hypothetical protein
LAAMLPLALDQRGAEGELCRALLRHPSLLIESQRDSDQEERWSTLGLRLSSHRLEQALPALLAGLAWRPQRELSALLGRVSEGAGGRALASAAALFGRDAIPQSLADLCEQWAVATLRSGDLELARYLLAYAKSRDAWIAAELLASSRATTADSVHIGRRVGEIEGPALRGAVFETALDAAVRALRHPEDAGLTWTLLVSSYPEATPETTLERLLESAMRSPTASGQAVLLVWICSSLFPAFDDLRQRNGQPKSRSAAELTSTLARRMSGLEIERLEPFADAGDRRSRRWWSNLVSEHRKADELHGR